MCTGEAVRWAYLVLLFPSVKGLVLSRYMLGRYHSTETFGLRHVHWCHRSRPGGRAREMSDKLDGHDEVALEHNRKTVCMCKKGRVIMDG